MKPLSPKTQRLLRGAALAAPLALLVFLALITTLSADDYWYATFFRQGLGHYFELMAEHYETFNGRMLVHFLAQLTLLLGNWAFALACGGLTALIGVLAAKCGEGGPGVLLTAALFCGGVLLLPTAYFVNAYLWISAFFNYVFPTALLMVEIFLLERLPRRRLRPGRAALLLGFAFLCGATTEQSGAVAVGLALCAALEVLLFRRERAALWLDLGCALSAALGLLTIFLSPATLKRAREEVGASLFHKLWVGAKLTSGLVFRELRVALLLSALLLAVGWALRRAGKRRLLPGFCALAALLPPAGRLLPPESRAAGLCLLLILAALGLAAAALVFFTGDHIPAYLLLGAIGAVVVMLPTNSMGERTLLPSLLLLLAALARLAAVLLADRQALATLLAAALAVGAAASTAPHIPAYLYNYRVEQENLQYIRELETTGVLYCNLDYDLTHTYNKMTYDGFFYAKYLEFAGFTEGEDRLILMARDAYQVLIGGQQYAVPAYRVDGGLYLHSRCLEALGGTVEYTREQTECRLGSRACFIRESSIIWTEAGQEQRVPLVAVPNFKSFNFLPEEVFTRAFDLTVEVDEAAHAVRLLQK